MVWAGSFPSGGPWELTVHTTEGRSLWSFLGPASLWPGLFSTKASWLGWKHGNPGEEVGTFRLLWAQGPWARCAAAWGQPVDAWRPQAIPQPHLSTTVPHRGASMWEANGGDQWGDGSLKGRVQTAGRSGEVGWEESPGAPPLALAHRGLGPDTLSKWSHPGHPQSCPLTTGCHGHTQKVLVSPVKFWSLQAVCCEDLRTPSWAVRSPQWGQWGPVWGGAGQLWEVAPPTPSQAWVFYIQSRPRACEAVREAPSGGLREDAGPAAGESAGLRVAVSTTCLSEFRVSRWGGGQGWSTHPSDPGSSFLLGAQG